MTTIVQGLSPRVRGNLSGARGPRDGGGSIPASAGKPCGRPRRCRRRRVYPRECGETHGSGEHPWVWRGLSPRVRGNHRRRPRRQGGDGSIPASAGKPSCRARRTGSTRVYPRECGETGSPRRLPPRPSGLSPRVRGNLRHQHAGAHVRGSIPASAGKPMRTAKSAGFTRVYPRECGETATR